MAKSQAEQAERESIGPKASAYIERQRILLEEVVAERNDLRAKLELAERRIQEYKDELNKHGVGSGAYF